jgi:hypothetical protein
MNNDDIHGLSGAYAVDDVERVRFEAHLAGCDTCRDEVSSLRGQRTGRRDPHVASGLPAHIGTA